MVPAVQDGEVFGLLRPSHDAHTLGIHAVAALIGEAGHRVKIAGKTVTDALDTFERSQSAARVCGWVAEARISRLGFSCRLDPEQATRLFERIVVEFRGRGLLGRRDGIRALYFAGLPGACDLVKALFGADIPVFEGDETPAETLRRLGLPECRIPQSVVRSGQYDEQRLSFGATLVGTEAHRSVKPENRSGYAGYGGCEDHVVNRIAYARAANQDPLIRVHVGPYHVDRRYAVAQCRDWLRQLAVGGFVDIASLGTSQLTQAKFGEDWADAPNGGGVPVNSESEYAELWSAARPMLVRTYAGSNRVPDLARTHERALHIAWHALPFWWFSQIDGRGPNPVWKNLHDHVDAIRYIAGTGKPVEPNVSHHFAFRGADDVTYILSAYLAAKVAKSNGVRWLVLQNMLNTPKQTWGVQDLAKARALLQVVRQLEDATFRVILQPRAGLGFFSPDLDRAKAQLAAASALMTDIDSSARWCAPIVHVVSYSEGSHLANPRVIEESVQIVRRAMRAYTALKQKGDAPNMEHNQDVAARTQALVDDVRAVLSVVERVLPAPHSPADLYRIMAAGFLVTPDLLGCREEFAEAARWRTALVNGGVKVVDDDGRPVPAKERAEFAAMRLAQSAGAANANRRPVDFSGIRL